MGLVMTAPAEKKKLAETIAKEQLFRLLWQNINLVQSPNGDHPHVSATVSVQEADEDDSS